MNYFLLFPSSYSSLEPSGRSKRITRRKVSMCGGSSSSAPPATQTAGWQMEPLRQGWTYFSPSPSLHPTWSYSFLWLLIINHHNRQTPIPHRKGWWKSLLMRKTIETLLFAIIPLPTLLLSSPLPPTNVLLDSCVVCVLLVFFTTVSYHIYIIYCNHSTPLSTDVMPLSL